MGLDLQIKEKVGEYSVKDKSFMGKTVLEFRKFYPFHTWVCNNLNKLIHDWDEIWEIRKHDIINFINYYNSTDYKYWEDENGLSEYQEDIGKLLNFANSINDSEVYYYDYVN